MRCLACGEALYRGDGAVVADEHICRECQRSPVVQIRVHLGRARDRGLPFERAWEFAIARVRWPHDTRHRREWKGVLGVERPPWMMPGEFRRNRTSTLARWGREYHTQRSRQESLEVLVAA